MDLPVAEAGNAAGWLVGDRRGAAVSPSSSGGPVLVSDAGRLDLPLFDGLRQHQPTGLNSDGTVVVGHADDDGGTRALSWQCR